MSAIAGPAPLASMMPLLITIAMGYACRHTILNSQTIWDAIDTLNFRLLIPALIISNLMTADIFAIRGDQITVLALLALAVIAGVAMACGVLVPSFRTDAPAFTSVFQTATRWNASIAIAICSVVFPHQSVTVVAIMMIAIMPAVNVLNIWVMVKWLDVTGASARSIALKIISNPIIIGCLVGIVLASIKFDVPPAISNSVDHLGAASIATILLSLGAGLKGAELRGQKLHLFLSCLLRLFLAPLVVLGGGVMLSVDPQILAVATVAMAMPTAANGYIIAQKMGGDAPLYASICAFQTSLALISIPIWLGVCAALLRV